MSKKIAVAFLGVGVLGLLLCQNLTFSVCLGLWGAVYYGLIASFLD